MKDQTAFWGSIISANIFFAPHLSENVSSKIGWAYLIFACIINIYEKYKKD